jgi:hypothetical protein
LLGGVAPAVTQENIGQTICVRSWTNTVWPPEQFTYNLKRTQIRACRRLRDYEEDLPEKERNLWPEPLGRSNK